MSTLDEERPTAPTPNVALAREALTFIEEHPELHNQGIWRAWYNPAVGCFAFHVVRLAGFEFLTDVPYFDHVDGVCPGLGRCSHTYDLNYERVRLPNGKVGHISWAAARALGVTTWRCDQMFSATSDVASIRAAVDLWTHEVRRREEVVA